MTHTSWTLLKLSSQFLQQFQFLAAAIVIVDIFVNRKWWTANCRFQLKLSTLPRQTLPLPLFVIPIVSKKKSITMEVKERLIKKGKNFKTKQEMASLVFVHSDPPQIDADHDHDHSYLNRSHVSVDLSVSYKIGFFVLTLWR